jgi:prepilin-type N-terminal cleavage/methylation domain-containing protein
MPRRGHHRPPGDGGFTLPELLIATVIGLFLLGVSVNLFVSAVNTEPRARDRAAQIQQARVMSERLTRELRQGSDATTLPTGCTPPCSGLTVLTFVPSAPSCTGAPRVGTSTASLCRVFYSCAATGTCTRTECPPTVTATTTPSTPTCGSAVQVISGLTSTAVFRFSPRTPGHAYISFSLQFGAQNGDDAITVQNGAALRNPPLGAS